MNTGSQLRLEQLFENLNEEIAEWAADYGLTLQEAFAQVKSWAGYQSADSFKMWALENGWEW